MSDRKPFWDAEKSSFRGPGRTMAWETATLLLNLVDDQLYTASEIVATRYDKSSPLHEEMFGRIWSWLCSSGLLKSPDLQEPKAWYGRTLKGQMAEKSYYFGQLLISLPPLFAAIASKKSQMAQLPQAMVLSTNTRALILDEQTSEHHRTTVAPHKPELPGPPSKPPPRGKARLGRYPRLILLVMVALMVFTGPMASIIHLNSFELLKHHGVAAAMENEAGRNHVTPDDLYKKAWLEYRAGFYQEAEQKAHAILGDDTSDLKLKADCHYLLGELKVTTGEFYKAIGFFTESYDLYGLTQRPENQYFSALGLVKSHTALAHYSEAQHFLDEAWLHYLADQKEGQKIEHLAIYYNQAERLALHRGDYPMALQHAKAYLDIYLTLGEQDGLAEVYSSLGFLYAANCDVDQGLLYTIRAQNLIFELHDQQKQVYNLINFILIQRIHGLLPDPGTTQQVLDWAEKHGDTELEHHLHRALNMTVECNHEQNQTEVPER